LRNHAPDIAAMDLFVVPTIGFDLLYAFVIVRLDRRDLVWINVTANPTAEWVARKRLADPLVRSMTEACKAGLGSTRCRYDCRRQNGRPIGRLEREPRQSA
jgi:hypothetical protein